MKVIAPFDATYIFELHGVTVTDSELTFTPSMGIDAVGDMFDRLVKDGIIAGFTISFHKKQSDEEKAATEPDVIRRGGT